MKRARFRVLIDYTPKLGEAYNQSFEVDSSRYARTARAVRRRFRLIYTEAVRVRVFTLRKGAR
jgi:hypothetical protein